MSVTVSEPCVCGCGCGKRVRVACIPPHLFMATFVGLFLSVGVNTWRIPHSYLMWPHGWAVMSIICGLTILLCIFTMTKWLVHLAGAVSVLMLLSRAGANLVSARHDVLTETTRATRENSAIVWVAWSVMIVLVWRYLVNPWVLEREMKRKRRE